MLLHLRPRTLREKREFRARAADFLFFSRSNAGSRTPIIGVQLGGSLAGKLSLELASTASGASSPLSSRGGFNELKFRTNVIARTPLEPLGI